MVLLKDVLKKVVRLDYLLLKQLIVQVNHDLKELLQVNLFSLKAFGEGQTYLNGRPLSKTEEKHDFASSTARVILDNPPADCFLTARQHAAAELLYHWGRILRPPELQPNHNNLLRTSIKNYIAHLGTSEAKLFHSLLDDIQEQAKSQTKTTKLQERKNEILRIIRDELKLDPLNLPSFSPGKPWVKAKVKSILKLPTKLSNELFTANNFDDAWEKLRESGQLKEEK